MVTTSVTAVPETGDAAVDLALGRAALYSALAIGFQPPTEKSLSRLLTAESRESLAGAAAALYPAGEPDLGSLIDKLAAVETHSPALLAGRYLSLFGHTARGPIPPYETEYGNEALFQQPQELGDLMGFYRAFGLTLRPAEHERPDHVSCECEFMTFLALKEAYALTHQDGEMLTETRKAQRLFLRDHLGRFVRAFAGGLKRADGGEFYGVLADLCLRFVTAECDRLEVPVGAADLGLRPAGDGGVPMACGGGDECAALPGSSMPEEAESL